VAAWSVRDARVNWQETAASDDLDDDTLEALRFAREETSSSALAASLESTAIGPPPFGPESVTTRLEEASLRQRSTSVSPAGARPIPPALPSAPRPATPLPVAPDASRESLLSVPPAVGSIPPPSVRVPLPPATPSLEAVLVGIGALDGGSSRITTPDFAPFGARFRRLASRGVVLAAVSMLLAIPCGHLLGRGLVLPPRAATTLQAAAPLASDDLAALASPHAQGGAGAPQAAGTSTPGAIAAIGSAAGAPGLAAGEPQPAEVAPPPAPIGAESSEPAAPARTPAKSSGHGRHRSPKSSAGAGGAAPAAQDHKT